VAPHAGISAGAARKGGPYRDRHHRDVRVIVHHGGSPPVTITAHPPSGPPLPQPGRAPDDPAAAISKIRAAHGRALNGGQGIDVILAAVEEGPALRATVAQVYRKVPDVVRSVRTTVAVAATGLPPSVPAGTYGE
jgi:hypothetical protein